MQKKFLRTLAVCGSFMALQLFDPTNVSLGMSGDDEMVQLMRSRHTITAHGGCPLMSDPKQKCVACSRTDARIAILQAEKSKEADLRVQLLQAKIDALKKK